MSDISNTSVLFNLYEEDLNEETTLDLSSKGLDRVPNIDNKRLCVLYLQSNNIETLPEDFFSSLPNLTWLDLRDNLLNIISTSIKNHECLTHLLLANNNITSLPNELGTVKNLKVVQLSGNPLVYPPTDIISAGIVKTLTFLHQKFLDDMFSSCSVVSDETASASGLLESSFNNEACSYNSVLDEERLKDTKKTLSVQFNEKDLENSEEEEYYTKIKGKCPKLPRSRLKTLTPHCQSSKYLKKLYANNKEEQEEKIKQSLLKDLALKKHKNLLATREKILQGRKNLELLRNWQKNYRNNQLTGYGTKSRKADQYSYPYDTSPEYMTLLSREDIEKDLPDKYKRRLVRRSKPTVPRKTNNEVHLAMKIKQLFENLEAIDLNREKMTPRTEQKVLLSEIQKISEIKQKLLEISTSNVKSVTAE